MAVTIACNITLLMDEDGNWYVDKTDDVGDVIERLAEDGGNQSRRVDLTVFMAPPAAQAISIVVPDDPAEPATVRVEG